MTGVLVRTDAESAEVRRGRGEKRGGDRVLVPHPSPDQAGQDGAPVFRRLVEESGRLLPQTMPTLATMELSRRWGTRLCGGYLGFGVDPGWRFI
jgi:hypothetical protein